jgi:hypothetical protein
MAKINTKVRHITVEHPHLKGVSVKARIMEPIEAMDMFSGFSDFQRVVAVTDQRTGSPLYNKKGEPVTATITNIPASEILRILEETVESWDGLDDENDAPIPCNAANLKFLFAPELNIDKEITDEESGETRTIQQTYADYIQEEVNKVAMGQVKKDAKSGPKAVTSSKR